MQALARHAPDGGPPIARGGRCLGSGRGGCVGVVGPPTLAGSIGRRRAAVVGQAPAIPRLLPAVVVVVPALIVAGAFSVPAPAHESRVHLAGALDGERVDIHHVGPADGAVGARRRLPFRPAARCQRIVPPQLTFDDVGRHVHRPHDVARLLQLFVRHKVDLVEQDGVGKGDLVDGLVQGVRGAFVQQLGDVLSVHQAEDRVKAVTRRNPRVREKSEHHGAGVGDACRLQQDGVEGRAG